MFFLIVRFLMVHISRHLDADGNYVFFRLSTVKKTTPWAWLTLTASSTLILIDFVGWRKKLTSGEITTFQQERSSLELKFPILTQRLTEHCLSIRSVDWITAFIHETNTSIGYIIFKNQVTWQFRCENSYCLYVFYLCWGKSWENINFFTWIFIKRNGNKRHTFTTEKFFKAIVLLKSWSTVSKFYIFLQNRNHLSRTSLRSPFPLCRCS